MVSIAEIELHRGPTPTSVAIPTIQISIELLVFGVFDLAGSIENVEKNASWCRSESKTVSAQESNYEIRIMAILPDTRPLFRYSTFETSGHLRRISQPKPTQVRPQWLKHDARRVLHASPISQGKQLGQFLQWGKLRPTEI